MFMSVAALAVFLASTAAVADASIITTFSAGLSPGTEPEQITAGPDGNLWFTTDQDSAKRVGRITPNGQVTEFALPNQDDLSSNPSGITAGPDGNVWFARYDRVGRITPAGAITEFSAGISPGSGVHGITTGPDGNLWFTELLERRVGRITTSGDASEFPIIGRRPSGEITAGPDGSVWFAADDPPPVSRYLLIRIDPTGTMTRFPMRLQGNPASIVVGPDGNLWLAEQSFGHVARVTPSGVVSRFSVGSSSSSLSGIAVGSDGNLWVADESRRVVRMTPSGRVTVFSTGGGFQPWDIASGPDGNLWLTDAVNGAIGRISPTAVKVSRTGIRTRATRVRRRGITRVRLRCASGDSMCIGTLTLTRARRPGRSGRGPALAVRRFSIGARRSDTLRVKLRRRGRLALARANGRLRVVATANTTANTGRGRVLLIGRG
jgi:streptogramin lyase